MAWFLLTIAVFAWLLTQWHDNQPPEDGRWLSAKARDRTVTVISGAIGLIIAVSVLFTIAGLILGF